MWCGSFNVDVWEDMCFSSPRIHQSVVTSTKSSFKCMLHETLRLMKKKNFCRHSREFERIYRLQSTISAPLCSHSELQCQSQGSQKKDHQKSSVSNETICNCSRCRNSSGLYMIMNNYPFRCIAVFEKEHNHKSNNMNFYKGLKNNLTKKIIWMTGQWPNFFKFNF